jgi:SAM-dependent methyltransferase
MNWQKKAYIQNLIAILPTKLGDIIYYFLQRSFGGLRKKNNLEITELNASLKIWKTIINDNQDPKNKIFLEIGTGRVPSIPIYLWLMGANKIYTFDIQKLLKKSLLNEFIENLISNEIKIKSLLGEYINNERYNKLKLIAFDQIDIKKFFNIIYEAPASAGETFLKDNEIDFCFSHNVFEHIDEINLKKIIVENKRILKENGLMIHFIDYSDHFSHDDSKISPINFLKYSEFEWKKLAGNRFMFMNRLRHDDFTNMFIKLGLKIKSTETEFDQISNTYLKEGKIVPSERFKLKSHEILSIRNSWFKLSN